MNSVTVRQKFLDFFREKSHEIVPSAPMVIKDDPTLMFTNAGMNQFKDIFLGNAPVRHVRIANSQKCLRVSGKHNDLEEVGHDGYHHTMFEMLGNWSFGDYFKKEAVTWAWEFLTGSLEIDAERLYASVFEGSGEDHLEMDREAYMLWKEFLPEDHILTGSKKDNFWEMGDTGPCGPCSEIHIDLRPDKDRKAIPGRELVNLGDPLVIEIWNLVFIQYNRKTDGSLEMLPKKHIDTGMGFERLCMVVQQKTSNYDTDIFQPLIQEISSITGIRYGVTEDSDVAMRVIADHIRAIAFAIADGLLPSNAKAGYVIRRILRRAVRYSFTFLGQKTPILYKLIQVLDVAMGDCFPELGAQRQLIETVIYEEEQSFLRTLESGLKLLDQVMNDLHEKALKVVSGSKAFELYDTYGFPLDLTDLMVKEKGMVVDHAGFAKEMEQQRKRSKAAATSETDDWQMVRKDQEEQLFVGYDQTTYRVTLNRFRKVTGKKKPLYHLVFNATPFYAESGGQVGDTGYIESGGDKIRILDTFREHGLIIHVADRLPEDLSATFNAVVDSSLQSDTAKNHSATHLLHYALREVLGKHVEQKGSLVNPSHLRFDFSHYQKVTEDEIRQVETLVNRMIMEGIPRQEYREMALDEARKMGAMALFGEKYGEHVRVIRFGDSVELCGGIHVESTAQIGLFKIISESSIAAGIRRIEAITGRKAEDYYHDLEDKVRNIELLLNKPQDLEKAVSQLIGEKSALEKRVNAYTKKQAELFNRQLLKGMKEQHGMNVVSGRYEEDLEDEGLIKDVSYGLRNKVDNLFLVVGATVGKKPHLAVMISDNLVRDLHLNAGEIVKAAAREFNGGGGGQPFFATAGGKDPDKIDLAIQKALDFAAEAAGRKKD